MNLRPLGYEPSELPSCSTPRRLLHCRWHLGLGQIAPASYWVVAEALAEGEGLADAAVAAAAAAIAALSRAWAAP